MCCSGSLHLYIDPRKRSDLEVLCYCPRCKELWRSKREAGDKPTPLPEHLNEKYAQMYPQD